MSAIEISNWTTVSLGEIVDIKTGKLNSNCAKENGKYPFFTCAPDPLKIDDYAFDTEAILLAGNNADGIFHLNYYSGRFNAYQRTYVVTVKNPNKLDLRYLSYFLQLSLNLMKSYSQGTSTKFLTIKILNNLQVLLPPIETQKAISKVLSDLDDKIKTNQQTNKILEAIGQAVFEHWFVDFEFPNEKGEPYKSSGGETVDSEIGAMPRNWKVSKLKTIARIQPGYAVRSEDFGKTGLKVIKIRDIQNLVVNIYNGDCVAEDLFLKIEKKFHVNGGDILIAMTGEVGRIGLVPETSNKMLLNQRLGKVLSIYSFFTYLFLKQEWTQLYLKDVSSGSSVQGNISNSDIEGIEFAEPDEKTLEAFSKIITPIYDKIISNLGENLSLSMIRDLLMPKLISRKLRVPVPEEK